MKRQSLICIAWSVITLAIYSPALSQPYENIDFETRLSKTVDDDPKIIRCYPMFNDEVALFEIYLGPKKREIIFSIYNIKDGQRVHDVTKLLGRSNNYSRVLGHVLHEKEVELFFMNGSENIISSVTFSLEKQVAEEKVLHDLKKNKELYIASQTSGDTFSFITIKKNSSLLNVSRFSSNEMANTNVFDFSNYKFDSRYSELYFRLVNVSRQSHKIQIVRIDDFRRADLFFTHGSNKIYFASDNIILTLDNEAKTTVVKLDLNSGEGSIQDYMQDELELCSTNQLLSANSLLLNQMLYQVKSCKNVLSLSISNMLDGKTIKTFFLEKEGENADFEHAIFKEEIGAKLFSSPENKYSIASKILRKSALHNVSIGLKEMKNDLVELDIGTFQQKESGMLAVFTPVWIYISKEYPYNIFMRNHLNLSSFMTQEIDNDLVSMKKRQSLHSGRYTNIFDQNGSLFILEHKRKEKKILLIQVNEPSKSHKE